MKALRFFALVAIFMAGCAHPAETDSPVLIPGNIGKPRLLVGGQQFVDSLLSAIENANQSIYMEMYEFKNDSIGNVVMSALRKRSQDGIDVRLVLDGWGSRGQWNDVNMWDSLSFPYVNHLLARNHRKVVIIDQTKCIIGSSNIADYYIKGLPELGTWHDIGLIFPAGSVEILKDGILERWISLLDSAKTSVRIINPYILPPTRLENSLISAVKRGVDVTFLFGEKGDIPSYFHGSRSFMSRTGANVLIYPGGFHHTKAMSVDGETLFLGSANMTRRALKRNLEENVVVYDKALVSAFDSLFTEYSLQSYPMDQSTITFVDRLYDIFSFLVID